MVLDYEKMCEMLWKKKNFMASRWGDGEWSCLLGHEGVNCDAHFYFKDMGAALRDVLYRGNDYHKGMQKKAMMDMGLEITSFLKEHMIGNEWYDADILHNASENGELTKFFDATRGRSVVVVGHPRLYSLARLTKWDVVMVPKKNCWLAFDHVKHEIMKHCKKNKVVLLSCSMMAGVLIDHFHMMFGDEITMIDCGSVFDPYCAGECTRRYHHKVVEKMNEA